MSQPAPATSAARTPRERFHRECPGVFYLDPEERAGLASYLHAAGVLATGESIQAVERAGEGNMNCTVRVRTQIQTLVVKQARPWVAKYPQFDAPWDRALRELDFYELVAGHPAVANCMPRLIHADRAARLLVLEDLGERGDLCSIYRGATLELDCIDGLADYLTALHHLFPEQARRPALSNRAMRILNHAHLFVIPLERDNGLALDSCLPGLQTAANALKADADYVARVRHLGSTVYLAEGDCLIHGDFFPGSFLSTPAGPRVIDPEFACFGRCEVDGGMFLAHLLLGRQPRPVVSRFLERYRPPAAHNWNVTLQLAGVEIMRRLIGYAQLPLAYGLDQRTALLDRSRDLVLRPDLQLILNA